MVIYNLEMPVNGELFFYQPTRFPREVNLTLRNVTTASSKNYGSFGGDDSMKIVSLGMQKAGDQLTLQEKLTGEHDFKSFCGNTKMKKSTVRCVDNIKIEESGPQIRLYFHGNGFLQNMVRIMTGTLLEVGYGNIKPEEMAEIIEACDRQKAGPTAPPQGLCLMKVDY